MYVISRAFLRARAIVHVRSDAGVIPYVGSLGKNLGKSSVSLYVGSSVMVNQLSCSL